MLNLNTGMTLAEVAQLTPFMNDMEKWFVSGSSPEPISLETLGEKDAKSVISGLQHMQEYYNSGVNIVHDLYTREEKEQSPDKRNTKLFFFPGQAGKPFAVICAGGAYSMVSSYNEGFPTAEALNRMGYNAFVLAYRVNEVGLMPKPIDDLAQAIRYIQNSSDMFRVDKEHYAVVGFSAGGHLAAEWGTENHGYGKYNISKPSALFLAYPAASTDNFYDDMKAGIGSEQYMQVGDMYLRFIGGENYTKKSLQEYCVEHHISTHYLPTYIIHCKDDTSVHYQTSVLLAEQLSNVGIPYVFRSIEKVGHAFGLGTGTMAEGWLDEAVKFWKNQI